MLSKVNEIEKDINFANHFMCEALGEDMDYIFKRQPSAVSEWYICVISR